MLVFVSLGVVSWEYGSNTALVFQELARSFPGVFEENILNKKSGSTAIVFKEFMKIQRVPSYHSAHFKGLTISV